MDQQILLGYLAAKGIKVAPDAGDVDILNAIGTALDNRASAPAQTPPPSTGAYVEPLLGTDPANVTPARAGAVFAKYAKDMCDSEGCDIGEAWQKAKLLKPELYGRMMNGKTDDGLRDTSPLANARPARPAPLTQKALTAPAFYLPPNVEDGVFTAAWAANGNQSVQVDPLKVYQAVCTYYMQAKGLKIGDARYQIGDDFPALAKAAGQTKY